MLMEHGGVAVPEIGTFYLRKISAKFNENRQILFPPFTGVYFSPNVDRDFEFCSLLIESGLKVEEAALLEKLITFDYKSSVQNNKSFELENLGYISDGVFFEKDQETFNRFSGLRELKININSKRKIIHDEKFDYYLHQKVTKNKSNLSTFIWPILIILLTTFCIVLWFLGDSGPKQSTLIVNAPVETAPLPIANNDSIYEEIDNAIIESKLKADSNVTMDTEIPEKSGSKLKETIVSETPLKECIVIVGTFSQPENASRMVKRIKAKGYKSYKQMHNGMTRVGVIYDCSTYQPDLYREKMKRIFNPDAWHLHDTL